MNLPPPLPAVVAERSFPFVTAVIAAVLVAVFALELVYGVVPKTGAFEPALLTWIALGASGGAYVIQQGEWYRLLSAPFLHANLLHLTANVAVLLYAGFRLEHLLGRSWFIVVYFLGALGGGLTSLFWDDDYRFAVGASGAIEGLYAALLVISFRYPRGLHRRVLQISAIVMLALAFVPSKEQGLMVDNAAHFGGMCAGAIIGFVLTRIWPRDNPHPGYPRVALALANLAVLACVIPVAPIARNYASFTNRSPEQMISEANEAIRRHPNDAAAFRDRGFAHHRTKDYDKSIADYSEAIRLDPANALFYVLRGDVYSDKGDADRAIEDYGSSLRLNPRNALAYHKRGWLLVARKNDVDRALADYNEAIRHNPRLSDAFINRALIYAMRQDDVHSIADNTEAIRLNPKSVLGFNNRGLAYYRMGDLTRALADFDEAIRVDPDYWHAYGNRAMVWGKKREFARQIAEYDEIIRRRPDSPMILNNRCWARAIIGELEQALIDCNESLRLKSDDFNAFDSRAFVFLKMARSEAVFRASVADYDTALRLNPKSAVSLFGRGLARRMLGDPESEADIAAAKAIKADIAEEFAGYNVELERFNRQKQ